uniref:Uncharacterized protein n=1 Tax=Photinus pyralis TaxID=7054 RepID=A0A1Y1KMI8_PHOPY
MSDLLLLLPGALAKGISSTDLATGLLSIIALPSDAGAGLPGIVSSHKSKECKCESGSSSFLTSSSDFSATFASQSGSNLKLYCDSSTTLLDPFISIEEFVWDSSSDLAIINRSSESVLSVSDSSINSLLTIFRDLFFNSGIISGLRIIDLTLVSNSFPLPSTEATTFLCSPTFVLESIFGFVSIGLSSINSDSSSISSGCSGTNSVLTGSTFTTDSSSMVADSCTHSSLIILNFCRRESAILVPVLILISLVSSNFVKISVGEQMVSNNVLSVSWSAGDICFDMEDVDGSSADSLTSKATSSAILNSSSDSLPLNTLDLSLTDWSVRLSTLSWKAENEGILKRG